MRIARLAFLIVLIGSAFVAPLLAQKSRTYPAVWFAPINDPNKPDWEILPQERHAGEVILSKRNELGILSNFAVTPFGQCVPALLLCDLRLVR